jgi:2-(1,2-epoxy-1,2-dihydrophenyl)acetyl-CoA isomerase
LLKADGRELIAAMANAPQLASVVLESREGSVLTLTMNRPEKLNALNTELASALRDAVRRAGDDASIRCVVLTGAGRAFCSGGDLTRLLDARRHNAGPDLEGLLRAGHDLVLALCDLPKPVVASVNGPAAGAGMNLALACDVRIAAEHASFGQSFAKVGLFPDFGGTYLLPRLAGSAVAAEMFWTGDMITAAEASRAGVVNRVVPAEKLAEETRAMAVRLAAAPPLAARAVKQVLRGYDRETLARALEFEAKQQAACFASDDCLEGLTAFFEKRKPIFRGR